MMNCLCRACIFTSAATSGYLQESFTLFNPSQVSTRAEKHHSQQAVEVCFLRLLSYSRAGGIADLLSGRTYLLAFLPPEPFCVVNRRASITNETQQRWRIKASDWSSWLLSSFKRRSSLERRL
jgi:hypothetical protein